MPDLPPFPNPPIVEALLDIRVATNPDVTLDRLAAFQKGIEGDFPLKEERFLWKAGIRVERGQPEAIKPTGGPDGYIFKSADMAKLVQSRVDGFTFNKLKPYKNWNTFYREARTLWEHYVEVAQPKRVVRLALRYINRIEIPFKPPLSIRAIKEYILTVPSIATGLPNQVSELFTRIVLSKEEDLKAIVTEAIEASRKDQNILPFIFDIDVFKETDLEPNDHSIWQSMDRLRIFKNEIFLKSLTNKCKRMFR